MEGMDDFHRLFAPWFSRLVPREFPLNEINVYIFQVYIIVIYHY